MQLFTRSLTIMRVTAPRTFASSLVSRRALAGILWLQSYAALACTPFLLCLITATALAQQQTADLSSSALPDAPRPQSDATSGSGQTSSDEGSASVSGIVVDPSGAAIPGAQVSLTHTNGTQRQTLTSGANGEFTFTRLPAGSYLVFVDAGGFKPFESTEFALAAQQEYAMPKISLLVGTVNTQILVRPTDVIAAAQIKAEEKQRLLGVVPNFYVSYVPNPAPMTSKQKFSLAARDTLDWTSFAGISAAAGIEQATDTFSGYGQGTEGYAKRWGALFANGRSSDFLGHAVFPSLFHQDPRYFYQGTGSKKSRLYHALSHPFIARSDSSGNLMPNYSYLLGSMCSGALSNAYYPAANRGASLVFTNSFIGLAGLAGGTVFQEFLGKRLTKNVPGSGKPDASGTGQP